MKSLLRLLASLFILGFSFAAGFFLMRNAHRVSIDCLGKPLELPAYALVGAGVLLGLLLSLAFHALDRHEVSPGAPQAAEKPAAEGSSGGEERIFPS
jgi:TRAP-type C4-dicarboxylate transport system permease small subunit